MLTLTLIIAALAITATIYSEEKRKARDELADRQNDLTPWGDISNVPNRHGRVR